MKKNLAPSLFALALTASLLPAVAYAQLRITEVESSESNGGSALPTADWWELSNLGASSVNLTGYRMDDNSASFALSVALAGITSIAPNESVVFFEVSGGTPLTVLGFQNWWGPSLGASVQIGTYSGSGVGLSASTDQVNLFDSSGTQIDGVSFATATTGTTFEFGDGAIGRSPTGLSLNGVNGAFTSANNDIGSPGVSPVPEPSTLALAGCGLAGLFGLRRFKNRQS
jgi:hypothetical protein